MEAFIFCIALYAANFPAGERACEHAETVLKYSEQYNLKPEVLVSMIYWESGWYPSRVSEAGACGLTQVIPVWTESFMGKHYSCKDLKDPERSIKVGAKILATHLTSKKGNYFQALCMYNQGPRGCNTARVKKKGTSYGRRVIRLSKKVKKNMKRDPCKPRKKNQIIY